MYNPPKGAFTPGTNGVGVVHAVGRNLWHLKPGQAAWNALWFSLNTEKPGYVRKLRTLLTELLCQVKQRAV
jgi:alcohol dehydrogenase